MARWFGRRRRKNKEEQRESLPPKTVAAVEEAAPPRAREANAADDAVKLDQSPPNTGDDAVVRSKSDQAPQPPTSATIDDEPTSAPASAHPEEKNRGMFARLRRGLSRTREGLTDKIVGLVSGRSGVTEDMFEELEELLIQADVGVPTTLRIVDGVRNRYKETKSKDPAMLTSFLAEEMRSILSVGHAALASPADGPKVYVVVGVNGAGKTTTIGKLAARHRQEGHSVLLGAGDTFRAAAIDQLAVWAERAEADIIKHQEGGDPAAVAYDAVQAARARNVDLLILDTAGRLQSKVNLMRELSKVHRVVEREWGRPPDETLLVIDANTGQNGLSQAKLFMEATPLTGVVLTKLDSTAKGGIVLAIAAEIGVPVKLIGVGEQIDDLRDFDAEQFVAALFPADNENQAL